MAKLPTSPFKVGPANLQWNFLNGDGATNDMGDTPKQEYKSTAILPLAQAKPFMAQLDKMWLDYNGGKKTKAKSMGYREIENEAGDKTGEVSFTFKTNTGFTQKDGSIKPVVIKIFRGNGADITADYHAAEKKAANESEGIIHGTAAIYDRNAAARGITLYLSAVQFTKYVPYVGAMDVEAVTEDTDDGLDSEDGLDVTPVQTEATPDI